MYEISLVPDVKSQLLEKQKLRNLIIFICILVAGACVAVILVMLSITGAQALTIGGQERELSCRADGTLPQGETGNCNDYGVPVMTFKNVNELLTIQDQMKNIGVLNSNKIKFSRVFGLLDVILPDGSSNGDTVKINELNADVAQSTLSFDAVGDPKVNKIGYHVLETFRKGLEKTYYDYGNYMRFDSESGSFVEIPSFCIKEKTEKGYTYAEYHRGAPGCEAPMVESANQKTEEEPTSEGTEEENTEEKKTETVKKEVITIRRTYDNSEDREKYKQGNDTKGERPSDQEGLYYFESACLVYDEDTNLFNEEETLKACPVLAEDGLSINSSSYGRGAEDQMVLSFSANVILNPEVFKANNKFMQIIGPSRQNVTDSYVEIRDMFTDKARDLGSGGEENK